MLAEVDCPNARLDLANTLVPGKKKVSEQGNHVYAKPTDVYSRISGWFRLNALPPAPLRLTLIGLSRPIKDRDELPADWFTRARLCRERHDPEMNFFGVNASQPARGPDPQALPPRRPRLPPQAASGRAALGV